MTAPLRSLWAASATRWETYRPLDGRLAVRICVVGAGYTGLSAALHLAESGASVAVLEAHEPGFGASGRNGGQVIPGLKLDPDALAVRLGSVRGERLAELAGGAADFVFRLIARLGLSCTAVQNGWIQAAHGPKALRQVEARAAAWAARGAPVEALDRAAVSELTGAQGYAGGLLDRRGGTLQPLSYARELARAAQTAGASVHGNSPALSLHREPQGWRVVTPKGAVLADQVLLCTNGYTDALWPGLARSIIPVHSYQAATQPLSDNLRRTILPNGQACSDTRRLLRYFRLDPAGRLVIGGRGKFRDSDDPDDYRRVTGSLASLFPDMGAVTWDYFWGGKVALTTDHLPHLHEPAPGLLAGLGFNGRGVAMATVMGKVLADRALGTALEDLALPVSPVRPIPLHAVRLPVLGLAIAWKRLADAWETRA